MVMKPFKFITNRQEEIPKEHYPNVKSTYGLFEGDWGGQDFFDFSSGVPLDDETVQDMVNRNFDYLNENPEETFTTISSGNVIVISYKVENRVVTIVSTKYMESNTYINDDELDF